MTHADEITTLNGTPKAFAQLVAEATDEQLDASPAGEWSAREVLAHMRDCEYLQMRLALERMLAEDLPTVVWFDNATWHATRNTNRDRKDVLLTDFALHRRTSTTILESLRPEDWAREAAGPNGTRFTVEGLLMGWVQHDQEHIAHLERLMGETVDEVLRRRARPE